MSEPKPRLLSNPLARRYVMRGGLLIILLGAVEIAVDLLVDPSTRLLITGLVHFVVGACFVTASRVANQTYRQP